MARRKWPKWAIQYRYWKVYNPETGKLERVDGSFVFCAKTIDNALRRRDQVVRRLTRTKGVRNPVVHLFECEEIPA